MQFCTTECPQLFEFELASCRTFRLRSKKAILEVATSNLQKWRGFAQSCGPCMPIWHPLIYIILQRWEEGRRNRDGPGGGGTQILADTLTKGLWKVWKSTRGQVVMWRTWCAPLVGLGLPDLPKTPPKFQHSCNPISIKGADSACYNTTGPPDFHTFLRPWGRS